ncbi:unnamed protein product, partial [Nesidiocoris tenuis]
TDDVRNVKQAMYRERRKKHSRESWSPKKTQEASEIMDGMHTTKEEQFLQAAKRSLKRWDFSLNWNVVRRRSSSRKSQLIVAAAHKLYSTDTTDISAVSNRGVNQRSGSFNERIHWNRLTLFGLTEISQLEIVAFPKVVKAAPTVAPKPKKRRISLPPPSTSFTAYIVSTL